jgi:hypothetical protein
MAAGYNHYGLHAGEVVARGTGPNQGVAAASSEHEQRRE